MLIKEKTLLVKQVPDVLPQAMMWDARFESVDRNII